MSGSVFGKLFRVTTFGESHGPAIGAVIDGCPAGLALSEADIQPYLNRRRPGQSAFTTARREADAVRILSGVFEGVTTGTPIALLIENADQRSGDYDRLKDVCRPGHADFTFDAKYGVRDHRGGGRSSGRETAARVAAGAVALTLLKELGITVRAWASEIAGIAADPAHFDEAFLSSDPLGMPDPEASRMAAEKIRTELAGRDSAGGIVTCTVTGVPAGLGEPVFDKLDARLAAAMLSIGAAKGFEMGEGFAAARLKGSENNDPFTAEADGTIRPVTNHAGGTLGGLSTGAPLVFRTAFKPTPTIASPQQTVDRGGHPVTLTAGGRHDPLVVPRAIVVVEAMAGLVIADALLENMGARMDYLKSLYTK